MHWSRGWSCTDHVAIMHWSRGYHALITCLIMICSRSYHVVGPWLFMHWSRNWSCTDHVAIMHWSRGYHALITCLIMQWSGGWSFTDPTPGPAMGGSVLACAVTHTIKVRGDGIWYGFQYVLRGSISCFWAPGCSYSSFAFISPSWLPISWTLSSNIRSKKNIDFQRETEAMCCAKMLSHVWLFATQWTVARQAALSMGILQARILEWVAMPSSRGSSQTQRLNPGLPHCRHIFYHLSHQGSP